MKLGKAEADQRESTAHAVRRRSFAELPNGFSISLRHIKTVKKIHGMDRTSRWQREKCRNAGSTRRMCEYFDSMPTSAERGPTKRKQKWDSDCLAVLLRSGTANWNYVKTLPKSLKDCRATVEQQAGDGGGGSRKKTLLSPAPPSLSRPKTH